MAGEWKTITLGEFIRLQRGHDLTEADRRPGNVPVVGSAGITGYHDRALSTGPGLTIGRSGVGSMGVVTYVPSDYWPHNTVLYATDFLGNDPRFACYFLQHLDLRRFNSGSAQASLNRNYIYPVSIRVPEPTEQQAIGCILGTLDDKIELNRRRNRTLETMARAIFQSWFVDFDPVRSKAAGGKPDGLSKDTAALFSDSFEDSELGPIPNGWRVGTLDEVAENPRRGIAADTITDGTPYIALEHMPRRSIALADWSVADDIESNKFEFHTGEILFGKLRPYFHKVGIAPVDGVCSTDILVVVPKHPDWFGFAACHFSSDAIIQHADRTSTGTKMPRTNWSDLARFSVVLPPVEVARVFARHFQGIVDRIHKSIGESRTLAALRDVLLPRLISGEFRVPDAEKIVGRCNA